MFQVLFISPAGAQRLVTGFPKLGGAVLTASELLPAGYTSRLVTEDGTVVSFRAGSAPVENEWGADVPCSVEVVDAAGGLVFDFNADSREMAARWARRVLGI